VAQEVCTEAGIGAEAEIAAVRTMADTKGRAKERTASIGEAAVEGRRVTSAMDAILLGGRATVENVEHANHQQTEGEKMIRANDFWKDLTDAFVINALHTYFDLTFI
jgi:hypothetical protein